MEMTIVESIRFIIELKDTSKEKSLAQKDADARTSAAGYKRKNVGSGIGKAVGGSLTSMATGGMPGANVPGIVAGHYVGKQVSNPEGAADLTKKSHRAGILVDKMNSMRQVKAGAKGAVPGALAGLAAGAATGAKKAEQLGMTGAGGAALGGVAGATGSAIKAGYTHAKKMGYGKVGRIGAIGAPVLTGMFTPKSQRDAKKHEDLQKLSGKK